MKHISHSEQETSDIALEILNSLVPNQDGATILALEGDLGSGKTTFTKALASHLGITATIVSPTFVIAKFYELPKDSQWRQLIHIDAYRLDSGEELAKLGFEREFADTNNLIVIEWPEKVAEILPESIQKLSFTFIDEGVREIDDNL